MGGSESSESGKRSNTNGAAEGQEIKGKKSGIESTIEIGVVVAAVVGLVAWGVGSLLLSGYSSKTMKAPGRGGAFIFRKDFEADPGRYFRDLRKP